MPLIVMIVSPMMSRQSLEGLRQASAILLCITPSYSGRLACPRRLRRQGEPFVGRRAGHRKRQRPPASTLESSIVLCAEQAKRALFGRCQVVCAGAGPLSFFSGGLGDDGAHGAAV